MKSQNPYTVSHDYEIIPPKSGPAYPIPCDDWHQIKDKINKLPSNPWLCLTLGSVSIGIFSATLIQIILGTYSGKEQQHAHEIAINIVFCSGIIGIFCFIIHGIQLFHKKQKGSEIVKDMDQIETRYPHQL